MSEDLRARVVALEQWKTESEIRSARHDERWLALEGRFTGIEKDISGINDTLTWLMRLVIGGMILAVVGFSIKGGLYIPSP